MHVSCVTGQLRVVTLEVLVWYELPKDTRTLQALGQHMLKRLQGFAAMSQMKRLALLLLARTFTDRDVMRLKV